MDERVALLGGLGAAPLGRLPARGRIPLATAVRALEALPAKTRACRITPEALRRGMEVEREHRDVTGGAVGRTARIAAAHLCERSDYYERLERFVEPRVRRRARR